MILKKIGETVTVFDPDTFEPYEAEIVGRSLCYRIKTQRGDITKAYEPIHNAVLAITEVINPEDC